MALRRAAKLSRIWAARIARTISGGKPSARRRSRSAARSPFCNSLQPPGPGAGAPLAADVFVFAAVADAVCFAKLLSSDKPTTIIAMRAALAASEPARTTVESFMVGRGSRTRRRGRARQAAVTGRDIAHRDHCSRAIHGGDHGRAAAADGERDRAAVLDIVEPVVGGFHIGRAR